MQIAASRDNMFFTLEDLHAIAGNRHEVSPETIHVGAVEATGTRQEFRRIDHVRCAAFVNKHLDCGILAYERTGDPGMIKMNVGQQNLANVANADALPLQCRGQGVVSRRRSGIDERHPGGTMKDRGRDDLGRAKKIEVNIIESGCQRLHD